MKLSLKVSNLLPKLISTRVDSTKVEDLGLWKFCDTVSKDPSHIQHVDLDLDTISHDVVELKYEFFKLRTQTASWRLECDGKLLKGGIITWAVCAGNGGFAYYPNESDDTRLLSTLVCKRDPADSSVWTFSVN